MLDGLRRMLGKRKAPSSVASGRTPATARYMRPDSTGILKGWNPSLRSKADDVQAAYTSVAAKVIDATQNQGWISGAVDQGVVDTIGPRGLALNAIPDADELGWTKDFTNAWSRRVERRFAVYSRTPMEVDARGKQTLAGLADAFVRQHYCYGESTSRILTRSRSFSRYDTRVQLFAPHRLVQDRSELQRLHQGVFLDADGLAIGYRVKTRVNGLDQTIDLPARDAEGRPIIVHVFDGDADQTRGISPLAPALRVTRQKDTLADATLTAALLQTIFAATVKSAAPTAEVFEGLIGAAEGVGVDEAGGVANLLQARGDFYEGSDVDLGSFGKVAKLFPGDELEMTSSNHPGGNYLPFDRNLGREIAACLGVTYEGFSGDFDGATYSALQMGIATKWPHVERRRERIAVPFYQSVYEAWIEEEIHKGLTPFPGGYQAFLRKRHAVCLANWSGPPKPTADDLKAARAMQARKDLGYSLQSLMAPDGVDWQQEMEQKAQETAFALANGLPDPHAPPPGSPLPFDNPMLADEVPSGGSARRN